MQHRLQLVGLACPSVIRIGRINTHRCRADILLVGSRVVAQDAHAGVINAVSTMLVERTYVATQAQFGVDDFATRLEGRGAITYGPLIRWRLPRGLTWSQSERGR